MILVPIALIVVALDPEKLIGWVPYGSHYFVCMSMIFWMVSL